MTRKPIAVPLDERRPEKPSTKRATAKAASSRKPVAIKASKPKSTEETSEVSSAEQLDQISLQTPKTVKKSRLFIFFVASISILVSLGIGLWFTQLIEALFVLHPWLGWAASGLLVFAIGCLILFIVREILAIWRIRKLGFLREAATSVLDGKDKNATKIIGAIVGLYESRKPMHWHISRLAEHCDDVMDAKDRMLLAERLLMKPLTTWLASISIW